METLKERAIQAAKERRERWETEKLKAANNFAIEAEDEFRDVFGADNIGTLNVKPVAENVAEIIVDGLEFEARRIHMEYDTYIRFYLRLKCEKCGRWFTYPIACESLADVGELIMNRQKCDECKHGNISPATESDAERVTRMLREIIEIVYEK